MWYFMENSATYHCCQQVLAFCSLDGSFYTKGGASQPAHIPTLVVMVDLGESKSSHKYIAISCPFQTLLQKTTCQNAKVVLTFFDMLFSTTKLEWTGSGYECVCKFYFHLNLPLLSMLECEQAARRPLWCEMNYRGSRKPVFASNNDRWRCFP